MKSNMKKYLALLLALITLTQLAACSTIDNTGDAAETAQPTEQGTPPEPPDGNGNGPQGTPPDGTPPDGQMGGNPPDGNPPGGNAPGSEIDQGSSANTIDADGSYSGESYTSTGDDENALRIDGASVTLDSISVDKASGASSNTESGDFYGANAAILATNGTINFNGYTITLADGTVLS